MKRLPTIIICVRLVFCFLTAVAATTSWAAEGDEPAGPGGQAEGAAAGVSLADVVKRLEAQQAELDTQKAQIAEQKKILDQQNALIISLQGEQKKIAD